MDSSKSVDSINEMLMKILIGERVGVVMMTMLLNFRLIRHKVYEDTYELTDKGLEQLNGLANSPIRNKIHS